jgi:hypothetical protein
MQRVAFFLLLPICSVTAQTALNLSQDLVAMGIASSNMTPNQPALDAGPLLTSGVAYAVAHQIPSVIANPGTYYFLSVQSNGAHVILNQPANVAIDFHGSNLILANEQRNGIQIQQGSNVTLQNFSLDYQQTPYTQVQVVSVDKAQRQVQFTVPSGWRNPSVFSGIQQLANTLNGYYLFFFRNGQRIGTLNRMSFQTPVTGNSFTIVDAGAATNATALSQIRPGDTALLAMRSNEQALFANGCTGCAFRNIQIYASPGASSSQSRGHGQTRCGSQKHLDSYVR